MRAANIGTLIVMQAEPVQALDQLLFGTRFITFLVSVFDTQDEGSAHAVSQ